jgi:hypothetical protein
MRKVKIDDVIYYETSLLELRRLYADKTLPLKRRKKFFHTLAKLPIIIKKYLKEVNGKTDDKQVETWLNVYKNLEWILLDSLYYMDEEMSVEQLWSDPKE